MVSACAAVKYRKKEKKVNGLWKRFHPKTPRSPPCERTMSCRESEPAISTAGRIAIPTGISYETIWAAARIPPSRAHLLLEAHPAIRIPTTTREVIAMT